MEVRKLYSIFGLLMSSAMPVHAGSCTIPSGATSCNFTQGGITYTVNQSQPSYTVSVAGTPPSTFALLGSVNLQAASHQYLQRAFGTSTDSRKGTWAGWIARNSLNPNGGTIFSSSAAAGFFAFSGSITTGTAANMLALNFGGSANIITSAAVTDFLWHHVMLAWDTTQATPAQRVHIYLDGIEVSYSTFNAPALNATIGLNISTAVHEIGALATFSNIDCDCQFADIHVIDGQQLTPPAFVSGAGLGATFPAAYTGTNGANGVWLSFCDAGHIGSDDGAGSQCGFGGPNSWTQINGVGWQATHP